jgi:membrane-associated phospholipid phosphatase
MKLKIFAKYISYLFIPPVMNFYIFIIYSIKFESTPKSYYGILVSLIFGLVLPLIAIIYFRRRGIISNNDATNKEERYLPYIYAIGFSLSGVIFSSLLSLNENIIMLWFVYLICSIFIIHINRFWKISAHAMGSAIPLGALVYFNSIVLPLTGVIFILIAISRILLNVHTFSQVLAGGLLGFSVSFVLVYYCL